MPSQMKVKVAKSLFRAKRSKMKKDKEVKMVYIIFKLLSLVLVSQHLSLNKKTNKKTVLKR